jgi:hypothetical protein
VHSGLLQPEVGMAQTLKVIRVFIGSPGGLDDERRAVRDVANEVNLLCSENWGCQFTIVGWEDTIPGFQRPQDKINEDLDKCDYFIGVLWNRWGSRPSSEASQFTSGFHEEFSRSLSHLESAKMKDLALYFRTIEIPTGFMPDDQAQKVIAFRNELIEGKKVFFKDYSQLADFKDLVRAKLIEIGWREYRLSLPEERQGETSKQPPDEVPERNDAKLEVKRLIDGEAKDFIVELSGRTQDAATSSAEVARFRLIASALYRHGNDNSFLGAHDANLMLKHFSDASLSPQEVQALVESGVYHYRTRTAPLWRWLSHKHWKIGAFDQIILISVFGSELLRSQALNILRDAKVSLDGNVVATEVVLENWLLDSNEESVFESACAYLGVCIDDAGLKIIEKIAPNLNDARSKKLEQALLVAHARLSPEDGLRRVIVGAFDKVDAACLQMIFQSSNSLPTTLLVSALDARAEQVRLRALKVLIARSAVPLSQLAVLLTDSNHEVRLLAVEEFHRTGNPLPDEVVKKTLALEKRSFGLLGFSTQADNSVMKYYDEFLANRLAELDYEALLKRMLSEGVFCEAELRAISRKYLRKVAPMLRENLRDRFTSFFEAALAVSLSNLAPNSTFLPRLRNVSATVRRDYMSIALDAICRLNEGSDIDLVRAVLSDGDIVGTSPIVHYLGRRGNWSDIQLIISMKDSSSSEWSILDFGRVHLFAEKTEAILSLSKDRLADFFSYEMDFTLKAEVVRRLPRTAIASLTETLLLRELSSSADVYRVAVAKRCIECLPKSSIRKLLASYLNLDDGSYYNVIHWLDLGASFPESVAKRVSLERHA